MLQALLEKIEQRFESQQTDRITDYASLVRLCVDKQKEPNTEKLADVLAQSGKSFTDFSRDCLAYASRIELREKFDHIPQAKDELKTVEQELAEERERFAAVEKQHVETIEKLATRRSDLARVVANETQIRSDLMNSCWDESLTQSNSQMYAEKAALAKRRDSKSIHIRNLKDYIASCTARIESWKQRCGHDVGVWASEMRDKYDDAQNEIVAARERLDEQREELQLLQVQVSEMELKIEENTEAMLQP